MAGDIAKGLREAAEMRDDLKERYWHRASALKREAADALDQKDAEIAALRSSLAEREAEIERLAGLISSSEQERYRSCGELLGRVTGAEASLAEALAALKPFSNASQHLPEDMADDDEVTAFAMGEGRFYCTFAAAWREARRVIEANEKEERE